MSPSPSCRKHPPTPSAPIHTYVNPAAHKRGPATPPATPPPPRPAPPRPAPAPPPPPAAARAQPAAPSPNKPVPIIIGYGAGGGGVVDDDLLAHALGEL